MITSFELEGRAVLQVGMAADEASVRCRRCAWLQSKRTWNLGVVAGKFRNVVFM